MMHGWHRANDITANHTCFCSTGFGTMSEKPEDVPDNANEGKSCPGPTLKTAIFYKKIGGKSRDNVCVLLFWGKLRA